jgi:hypothetical protein
VYRLDRPNAPMSYVTASKEGGSNLTDRVAGSELIDDASLFDMMSTTSSSSSSVASNENIFIFGDGEEHRQAFDPAAAPASPAARTAADASMPSSPQPPSPGRTVASSDLADLRKDSIWGRNLRTEHRKLQKEVATVISA